MIAASVDTLFRKKTGITRPLVDPTSRSDLELRRTWLLIRDELVGRKENQVIEDDRRDSLLTAIPYEMEWEHWNEGAKLLETWFERQPTIAPKYSASVTDLIKMDWVLKFPRAKSVFDQILADKIWTNEASRKRLAEMLRSKPLAGSTFGDLSLPVPQIDLLWVNSRPVTSGTTVDGLTAALGGFQLQVAVTGQVLSAPGATQILIDEIAIYVKDSFDFNDDQFLGVWGDRDDPINDSDFRKWRNDNHLGGDFQVFSDVKRIKLSRQTSFPSPRPEKTAGIQAAGVRKRMDARSIKRAPAVFERRQSREARQYWRAHAEDASTALPENDLL